MLKAKICGLTENNQVETCIQYGASMCGFILFYPKSHRNLSLHKVRELTSIKNAKSNVAVMVKPNKSDLERIKDLNFQYYQIYGNQTPDEIRNIKKTYKKKIIVALQIKSPEDVLKYKIYDGIADIILFDSAGLEKSLSWNFEWVKKVPAHIPKMIAGNIGIDTLENVSKIADIIIDVSGNLETNKVKDLNKIKEFLLKVKETNELN